MLNLQETNISGKGISLELPCMKVLNLQLCERLTSKGLANLIGACSNLKELKLGDVEEVLPLNGILHISGICVYAYLSNFYISKKSQGRGEY